jgi:glycosyltransferase involved in cell wall biosynthesis
VTRVISAVGTWNEAEFLPRWLSHIEKIADGVVAIDDGSTDETVEILRGHPSVLEVTAKPRGDREEVPDRRRLTRMALDHDADWILFLDADEVFDGRIVEVMPELVARDDVGEYRFRKYTLWRGEDRIRVDRPEKFSAWSPCRMVRASPKLRWRYPEGSTLNRMIDVVRGRTRWRPQYAHGGIANLAGATVDVPPEEVVIVHYASVSYPGMVWKQLRYAVGEARAHPRRDGDEVADYCFQNLDEKNLELSPLPTEWGPLP